MRGGGRDERVSLPGAHAPECLYEGAWGCLGSRRWPSTTAVATSMSLRFAIRVRAGARVHEVALDDVVAVWRLGS